MLRSSALRLYSTLATKPILIQPTRIINRIPDLNIQITQRAASRLNEIYKASNEVLKIGVESGGCHGFQYNLDLIPADQSQQETKKNLDDEFAENNDKSVVYVMPPDGGKVIIDENSLKILNDTVLNYTTELIGSQFKIEDGNLKSSCGCGSSFDADVKK